MKRPSIHDPRVFSIHEHRQDAREEPAQATRDSLLVKLPVDARAGSDKLSAKRKRVGDVSAQRVVRPKLSDGVTPARKATASTVKKIKANEEQLLLDAVPSLLNHDPPAEPSPARKTYGKQKPTANRPVQGAATHPSSSRTEQLELPSTSAAETVKSRRAVNKPKPTSKKTTQQQAPAQATPSSSKTPTVVKREAKGPRQPNGACKSCRARHQKCDRTQPACGRCAKGGLSCEYPSASGPTASSSRVTTDSPKKKQALLPIKKPTNEADHEHALRGRSVTVSPEAPRQQGSAKRPMPASPSKKPTVTAPTAASSRAPRARNTKASPQKKQK